MSWPLRPGRRRVRPDGHDDPGLALGDGTVAHLGTVGSWLIDVVNIVIGNLDEPGGAMWPLSPAAGPPPGHVGPRPRAPGPRRGAAPASRAAPSVLRRIPRRSAGRGDRDARRRGEQIRALFTVAGQPRPVDAGRRPARAGARLARALVSVDPYLTETTRLADVDPARPLAAGSTALRRRASTRSRFATPPATRRPSIPLEAGGLDEADILAQLAAIAMGVTTGQAEPHGRAGGRLHRLHDRPAGRGRTRHRAACGPRGRRAPAAVARRRGVERLLDLRIRSGPHGDGFGTHARTG